MKPLSLQVSFQSFWRIGSGGGLTGRVDTRVARDDDGFPYVPGRHLRGILREAVREAHACGWIETSENQVFGARGVRDGDAEAAGVVRVEDARLPANERAAILAQAENRSLDLDALLAGLFRTRRKTAMDTVRGVAKAHSLRVEEISVPLTLTSEVSFVGRKGELVDWKEAISTSLPLIRYMGGGRTRGLGRCKVIAESGAAHG